MKGIWRKSLRMKDSPVVTARGSEPMTMVVIGCGSRGNAYSKYALEAPDALKIVAIAEPRQKTRLHFAKEYNIDRTLVFNSWQDLHAASTETIATVGKRLADAVLIAVLDDMHIDVCVAFAEQGYHILCEKPMATSLTDCIKMETAVKKAGVIFGMGHVMRYSPYHQEISAIVHSGSLGTLINVVQVEPVGYYHFAHSYVRGNWRKEKDTSFSLMTKSCHDIDIICHWFSPTMPSKVSSFGSLQHFRKESKPASAGSATRCLECAGEKDCAYSAKRIYLDSLRQGNTGWPVKILVDGIPDLENITEALQTGPYGTCVYEADNDVCDNQVVNLQFENGCTASFTMVAFTSLICDRQLRMHFSHGEIVGDMTKYTVNDFRAKSTKTYTPRNDGGGHGGGDKGLIRTFVEAVRTGRQDILGTDVAEVLKSHLTVFAAEASRKEGRIVDCAEYEAAARRAADPETATT